MSEVDLIRLLQPKSISNIFNIALPSAESSLFSSDITITENGTIRITFQASIAGVLRVTVTRSGSTKILNLNSSTNLVASSTYSFDIPVKSDDIINIRYSTTGGTIDYCEVQFYKVVS